jgi:hypothetical protein
VILAGCLVVLGTGVWVSRCSSRHAQQARSRIQTGMPVAEVFAAVGGWRVCTLSPSDDAPASTSSPERPFDVILNGRGKYWVEGSGLLRDQEAADGRALGQLLGPLLSSGRAWRLVFEFDGLPSALLTVRLDGAGRVTQVSSVGIRPVW